MKKILVTGSNGLLGQKLADLIIGSGRAELICTAKGANRRPEQQGCTFVSLDITDARATEDVLAVFRPDVIINTAAVTNVDACELDKELCRKVNVEAVANLVNAASRHDIHLIHLSSDFVFDGLNGAYAEEDAPSPVSFYGQSKADAEKLVLSSDARCSIVRTILVYGVTPGMSRSNIVLWVKSALEKGEQIRVVNDQWRMPTLAENLAEACLLIAEKEALGTYHISGAEMMSVFELAERVADFWGLDRSLITPVSSDSLNQTARRPLKTGFVLDKAILDLNYKPRSFIEGLAVVDRQLASLQS
ncbi:NAD(P)-dependent oxidoreductase [Arcticibacter sp. MXS-1]|uniref:SDR family oxidoreductase n=1 Tax=Arcticibacter sp. MXS-1 TaxID=3341726 RepID=UPI0035A83788